METQEGTETAKQIDSARQLDYQGRREDAENQRAAKLPKQGRRLRDVSDAFYETKIITLSFCIVQE